jgi:hypothetical protein
MLEWAEHQRPTSDYAVLTVETAPSDQEFPPVGQIYADLGQGFSERNSDRFRWEGKDPHYSC